MKASLLHILLNFLCTALLLVLPSAGHAQQHSFKIYNVNDGLPSTTTSGVYQDRYGYLWVGTAAGLSRFDGRQFVNYSIADGLPALGAAVALQDSRERLWVRTYAGMAQFRNNRFITYPTSDNQNDLYVFNIIETKNKRIWALTIKGAYEFADSVWNKIPLYPGFENRPCRNIIETNGELYVCYPADIVCRTREGKWLHIATNKDYGSIFNVMSIQNNQIWVNSSTNIYEIRNHRLVPLFKQNMVAKNYFSYFVDSKKRLWLEGENFLKVSKSGAWRDFSDLTNYDRYYSFINEDSNHNIWTNTTRGLLKIKDISFSIIDKNDSVPLDGIYNIIALPDSRILFSSGSKTGLLLYANNSCKQIMPPKAPGNENYYRDPVDAYTFDDKNTLWMVTRFKKLLHFNGNTLEDF